MEFAVILLVVLLVAGVALGFMPRGRRSRYDTVEERPPGRD
jgi:hypothetical protein